jgi:hypothetical protein
MEKDKNLEQNLDKSNEKLHISDVSGSLPNWWDLQIEQLKDLEKVIENRINELEGNDR